MYTLRIIEETKNEGNTYYDQMINNHALGNSYSVIKNGASDDFHSIMKEKYPEWDKTRIKAIVLSSKQETFFIDKGEANKQYSYFIMTENGKTFERL